MAKKSKKQIKEEKLLIQRDRLNMLIKVLPTLLEQPMFQALVWWKVSSRNRVLDFTNKLIVTSEFAGLTEAGAEGTYGKIDIEPVDLPQGVVLGAIIQEAEDSLEFADWLSDKSKSVIARAKEEYTETSEEVSGLIDSFFGWLGDKKEGLDESGYGTGGGIGN